MVKINTVKDLTLQSLERKSALSLASIFSCRMLGLFMVLPVLSIYAHGLEGATPLLIGFAMGSYGLTQACLQLPFGMLSDKLGRKPIIIAGLLLFILGSIVCALSHSITGIIFGRALQGAGAVGSTIIALIADLTREEVRTKAMATVGATIGLSFAIAMVAGPILNGFIGVHGIFWLTAMLGIIAIAVLLIIVPQPQKSVFHRDAEALPQLLKSNFKNPNLLRLDLGIFALHAILTASFVIIPVLLHSVLRINTQHEWLFYLPVLGLAFFSMIPFIIIAEKKRQMKKVFISSIAVIALTQLALWQWHHHIAIIGLLLYLFFTAFTLLEASLPSLISKTAPAGSKGTAMGIYSSAQFFGIFVGGSIGGFLYGHHHLNTIFLFTSLLAIIWLITAIRMPNVNYLATFMLNVGTMSVTQAKTLTKTLAALDGVADVVIICDEGTAYLKIDNAVVSKADLLAYSKSQ